MELCILVISAARNAAYAGELERGDGSNQPFILREKGTKAHDIAVRWLKKQPWYAGMRTPAILSDMESIKNLVLENAGMTIIPRCCARQCMEQGLMKEVASAIPLEESDYFMIERANEAESDLVTAFKKHLVTTEKP